MPDNRPTVLLTRPQAQAERFAQALGDIPVVISPLMRIEQQPLDVELTGYRGLVFTSENGVWACPQCALPAFCVGDRTAQAAKDAGMRAVSAKGSADDLVRIIADRAVEGPLLHIRGEHTRGDVAGKLRALGLRVDEVVGYRQVARPLSEQARKLLGGESIVILPLFSPRTARLFVADVGRIGARVRVVAISEAVKEALSGSVFDDITVSTTPDAKGMIAAIQGRIDA
ncbi:uroporphyrinogen-III synthase [Profundibacter sp.]|uniref:uroporphyrinogen-III synthase n=1 Tax=Profundibacter sp. TaxID=3101071 RepID=UPI003D12799C